MRGRRCPLLLQNFTVPRVALERRRIREALRSPPSPFDQRLWRSIQEDQFGVKLFFQFQLARFPHLRKQERHSQLSGGAEGGGACLLLRFTRKMSVHSLRIRSTQGSSSNMMEWLIPLKNSLTNFPITRTTEAYNPIILRPRRREAGTEEQKLVSLYWKSSAQERETAVLYPYPARKPRLGGLTLSLKTRSCRPASRLLLTTVLPPTGTKLATGWSTIHHSWTSVL